MKTVLSKGLLLLGFLTVAIFLCREEFNTFNLKKISKQNPRVSKELTIICTTGRLGNKMSMYAVLYGLAKKNNRIPVPPPCLTNEMNDVFEYTLKTPSQQEEWIGHDIGKILNQTDIELLPEVNIITGNLYAASYTFFYDVASEIRREFTFTKKIKSYADEIIRKAKGLRKEATFVGVHVRRGDYFTIIKKYNLREVTEIFYKKAFEYFRSRYPDCVFVVTSDDISWCKRNLKDRDVFFQDKRVTAPFDLAVLASCNHSIIGYGTYGYWGAFLAGGETVYPANSTDPGSWYNLDKTFYLPEWVGIS